MVLSSSLCPFSFGVFFERRRRKKKDVVDAREASIARRTDARLGRFVWFESRVCIARSFGASDGRVESDREETGDVKKLYRGEEGKEAKAPKAEVNFFDAPFADVNAKDVASTVNVAEFSGGFAPRRALQVRLIRFLSRLFLVLTTTRVFFLEFPKCSAFAST